MNDKSSGALGLQVTTDWTKAAVLILLTVEKIAFNSGQDEAETREEVGQGALQAYRALGVRALPEGLLQKLPLESLALASKPSFAAHVDRQRRAMLASELMQISMRFPKVDKALDDANIPQLTEAEQRKYFRALLVTEGRHGHFAMRWKECCARSHARIRTARGLVAYDGAC